MSELAKKLFEGVQSAQNALRETAREGLGQLKAEAKRQGTQTAMELASGLFAGHAYVQYGPGQYMPTPQHDQTQQQEQTPQHEHAQHREQGLGR